MATKTNKSTSNASTRNSKGKNTGKTTKKTTGKVTTSKKTSTTPPKSTKTTAKPTTKPEEVILKRTGEKDKLGNEQYTAIKVYSRKPSGWVETKTGAPKGYKAINNGQTAASGKRRIGFIRAK